MAHIKDAKREFHLVLETEAEITIGRRYRPDKLRTIEDQTVIVYPTRRAAAQDLARLRRMLRS